MRPQFPVYTECTFKCEIPDKPGEPKDCAKSCEMVKTANKEIIIYRQKVDLYENAMKLFIFRIDENNKNLSKTNTLYLIKDLFISILEHGANIS